MDEYDEYDEYHDAPRKPPVISPTTENWVQSLAFEVALGYFTPQELQTKFQLTPEAYSKITELDAFRRAEADYRREIDDEGIAFRLRARKSAEQVLEELYAMAFDRTIAAKDRLKAMEMMCRYAGFESQAKDGDSGGLKLQIYTNLNLNREQESSYTIEIPQEKAV